jgi:hypothetical protein
MLTGHRKIPTHLATEIAQFVDRLSHILSSVGTEDNRCQTPGANDRSAQQLLLQSAAVSPYATDNSTSASSLSHACFLDLADGQLRYLPTEIPDPPALSFAHDLARLDRLWDDRSPQWDNTSPLYIQGKSIALVHWPTVYRHRGTKQWRGIKQRWFEWKVRAYLPFLAATDSVSYADTRQGVSTTRVKHFLGEIRSQRHPTPCHQDSGNNEDSTHPGGP